VALLEPPLPTDPDAREAQVSLRSELAEMVATGRRGDAVERFQKAVGLSDEMIAQMRHAPFRPTMEAIAHTLVYDTTITSSLPLERLATITTPALVIDSTDTSDFLRASSKAVSDALPHASHRSLRGQFHSVPAEVLAPVLCEFLKG
jgi:hypothetical protein